MQREEIFMLAIDAQLLGNDLDSLTPNRSIEIGPETNGVQNSKRIFFFCKLSLDAGRASEMTIKINSGAVRRFNFS